ncbi:MAG: hypothetical protein JJV93_02195 [Alphaproteobacteria bacterium]|nr:hypothetical protein [Alphaproteobacteria bacterium]MBL0718049.1 hypothetical protein [Alphaproteobacteria bacterium]
MKFTFIKHILNLMFSLQFLILVGLIFAWNYNSGMTNINLNNYTIELQTNHLIVFTVIIVIFMNLIYRVLFWLNRLYRRWIIGTFKALILPLRRKNKIGISKK